MPLSSVLGASSLIRPGVCTTATRPSAPYTGQTIYDTTTSTVLSWNGASWATVGPSASGLAFITSTAVSATSFSINNCFSAAYNNYRIVYPFTVSDQNMTFRLRVSGADNSTANYDYQRLFADGTSITGLRTLAATSWTDMLGSAGASYWVIDIMNPFVAAPTAATVIDGYNAAASVTLLMTSLQQRQSTSFDGFTIAGANSMTGTCYVYGYSLS